MVEREFRVVAGGQILRDTVGHGKLYGYYSKGYGESLEDFGKEISMT